MYEVEFYKVNFPPSNDLLLSILIEAYIILNRTGENGQLCRKKNIVYDEVFGQSFNRLF